METQARFARAWVDAVEHERVEVNVAVQRAAEALDEGDGAALRARNLALLARAATQRREDAAHEDAEHGLHQRCVVGEPVAQREGQREHPLAHGHLGQHAIDEVRGGVGHTAAAAGGAEAAALAREGDDAVETAVVTADAHEAVGEDPAAEKPTQLARDEAGRRSLARGRAGEEGLELCLHDLVENALLGLAARVASVGGDAAIAQRTRGRGRTSKHECTRASVVPRMGCARAASEGMGPERALAFASVCERAFTCSGPAAEARVLGAGRRVPPARGSRRSALSKPVCAAHCRATPLESAALRVPAAGFGPGLDVY